MVVRSQENIWSACGTVISESQQPNFSLYCYYLLNFKAILCFNWSLHCTVLFLPKRPLLLPTNFKIRDFVVCQNGTSLYILVPTSLYYLSTNLIRRWLISFIFVVSLNRPLSQPWRFVALTPDGRPYYYSTGVGKFKPI